MKKLGLLFTSYGPYHIARLNATCQMANTLGWHVAGIELTSKEEAYQWKRSLDNNTVHTVSTSDPLEKQSSYQLSLKLWVLLSKLDINVLAVAGYQPWPMLVALIWCIVHKRPCILMSDSKADDSLRNDVSEFLKSQLIRFYKAALVAGQPHKNYLTKLGFRCPIWLGYDVVDNDQYLKKGNELFRPIDKPYFFMCKSFSTSKKSF